MNKDSRITLGLALVYFFNGLVNLFGPAKTFAPLVFIDSFLLGLLGLVFVFLPPVNKWSSLFLVFAAGFILQGFFYLRWLNNVYAEVANISFFILLCTGFYIYTIVAAKKHRVLMLVPLLVFVLTIFLRWFNIDGRIILATGVVLGMFQLYVLARPDIAEEMSVPAKRFYLLMILVVFFDIIRQVFYLVNFQH